MAGRGAAVATAEEDGQDSKKTTNDPGDKHDGRHCRRHVDAVTAPNHDGTAWSSGIHVLSRAVQHHLQQSNDRR